MRRKNFYAKLRRVADQFRWKIKKDGCLRGYIGKKEYCPLTAVSRICYNNDTHVGEADIVAEDSMNMSWTDYDTIITAADEKEKDLEGSEKIVRRTLLRAVGLHE